MSWVMFYLCCWVAIGYLIGPVFRWEVRLLRRGRETAQRAQEAMIDLAAMLRRYPRLTSKAEQLEHDCLAMRATLLRQSLAAETAYVSWGTAYGLELASMTVTAPVTVGRVLWSTLTFEAALFGLNLLTAAIDYRGEFQR